jgi:hypothetical protein
MVTSIDVTIIIVVSFVTYQPVIHKRPVTRQAVCDFVLEVYFPRTVNASILANIASRDAAIMT